MFNKAVVVVSLYNLLAFQNFVSLIRVSVCVIFSAHILQLRAVMRRFKSFKLENVCRANEMNSLPLCTQSANQRVIER